YLEPYRSAETALPPAVAELAQLTIDNSSQQRRLETFKRMVADKVQLMSTLIDERRSKGIDAAIAMFKQNRSQDTMEELRAAVSEMMDDEQRLLAQRNQASSETGQATLTTIIVGAAASILLVLVLGIVITRSVTGPTRALLDGVTQITSGN